MTVPRVVVFGWGNVSRGDDALGPLLLAEVARAAHPGVVTIEDFQLQIEHALDMVYADLVLFIDAGTGTPPPWTFTELDPTAAAPPSMASVSSHALSPQALLGVYRQVQAQTPPPAFLLCVSGVSFELGQCLSEPARHHLASAQAFLKALMAQPDAQAWRALRGSLAGSHPLA